MLYVGSRRSAMCGGHDGNGFTNQSMLLLMRCTHFGAMSSTMKVRSSSKGCKITSKNGRTEIYRCWGGLRTSYFYLKIGIYYLVDLLRCFETQLQPVSWWEKYRSSAPTLVSSKKLELSTMYLLLYTKFQELNLCIVICFFFSAKTSCHSSSFPGL